MASVSDIEHIEYEERRSVGVWTVTDFAAHFQSEEAIERSEAHYRERASKDRMRATVVAIENAGALGSEMRETLDHITEEWSQLADSVGINRLAYVADGTMANAVKRKIDADVETDAFDSVDEAVEWCQQA